MNVQRANVMMVILIVLLAIGLGLPTIQRKRATASWTATRDQLRIVAKGLEAYHDNHGCFPPIYDRASSAAGNHVSMPHAVSFHVHLLPYVDQKVAYASYLPDGKGNADASIPAFLSPSDGSINRRAGVQCFAANLRVFSSKGAATPSVANMPPLAQVEPGRMTIGIITNAIGSSNLIALAPKLAECSNGGSRYAADPTSPYAAFFGQNAAQTTAHYSNPAATFQWAPRGSECLTMPLMAQSYLPQPLWVAYADGSVRHMWGGIDPGVWNRIQSPGLMD